MNGTGHYLLSSIYMILVTIAYRVKFGVVIWRDQLLSRLGFMIEWMSDQKISTLPPVAAK